MYVSSAPVLVCSLIIIIIEWATLGTFLDIICYVQFSRCSQSTNRQETLPSLSRKRLEFFPLTASIRFDVSLSLYPTEFRGSMSGTSCNQCVEVFSMLLYSFDSDINLFPSVHVVYRVPVPQGLHCAEEVQRRKGIMKKLSEQKNGGRKGLRRHLEQSSWIPQYFSISTSTLVLSLYCHHVSESVNCSTSFKLLCVTLGWTSAWYWYYNS